LGSSQNQTRAAAAASANTMAAMATIQPVRFLAAAGWACAEYGTGVA